MIFEAWMKKYRKWEEGCLEEFREWLPGSWFDGDPVTINWEDSTSGNPDSDARLVEFSEDGDAYLHGLGGVVHIRKVVTPWTESRHYTE